MVSMRNLPLTASAIIGFTSAAPTMEARQTWVPGTQINTQEFYIRMTVTDGDTKYTQWACKPPFPPFPLPHSQPPSRSLPHRRRHPRLSQRHQPAIRRLSLSLLRRRKPQRYQLRTLGTSQYRQWVWNGCVEE
jgi:hypothetical protein